MDNSETLFFIYISLIFKGKENELQKVIKDLRLSCEKNMFNLRMKIMTM